MGASEVAMRMNHHPSQVLTAGTLSSLTDAPKTQLQDWLEKPQTHEQLAVEGQTSRSLPEMEKFLGDIGKKMDGKPK
ncbi:hypothetical protein OEA41_009436 [Lepraria neglecta]|uniref:Uncharacterized protein n=1 Tax=Lepraria neglecta TaxID=209136 RepID=A0AAE0DHM8_9LECA|nr:hypothetical protein OEA41_009436 [Lepraria neglecta]